VRYFIDTNILLYAVNSAALEHGAARNMMERLRSDGTPWCLSWSTAYEFLRVSTHARVFPRPLTAAESLHALQAFLRSGPVTVLAPTERHEETLSRTLAELPALSGNLMHDVHSAVLMREHGVAEILTADMDGVIPAEFDTREG
jgi:toxin-antitoxin system PIN domain toxin